MICSHLVATTLVSISTLVFALPAPPKEPTFSVGGRAISTSPFFDRQHVYGNAPATKPKNTVVLPDQHINLQPTASGNLQSTHPVAVQEYTRGVPQPPRQGYVKVSPGRWGDINHYAATYPCKRSPGAPCTLSPKVMESLAAEGKSASTFAKVLKGTGSALGRAGRLAAGPEGMVATAAIDNAILGYQTSSKYNGVMKNFGRDYEQAAMRARFNTRGGGAGTSW